VGSLPTTVTLTGLYLYELVKNTQILCSTTRFSPNIIHVIKSLAIQAGHTTFMGEKGNAYRLLVQET
jgi:hypothetical protein